MLRRFKERLPAERRERLALCALLAVLVAGGVARLWLVLSVRPALVGYSDSYTYISAAAGPLFGDPLRPVGYPVFLRLVHELSGDLSFTIVVQHGLGLASALLLYLAARRVGVSRWWSLLPAGVMSLAGPQIMIEHAPLTEGLFAFLQSAALYAAARAVGERDWSWALVAGALTGASATVRALGLFLVGALVICLVTAPADAWRRRLVRGIAALAAAAVVVGVYVVVQERETGYTGITRAGSWNLYGRVAPFADCDRFDPPEGTRVLCEDTPESKRPGSNSYIFDRETSPAIAAFGTPFEARLEDADKLRAFSRAAFLHQPLDWLEHVVREDLPRYVSSERVVRGGVGLSFDDLQDTLLTGFQGAETNALIPTYYTTRGRYYNGERFDTFRSYERATRVVGVAFVVLALLALAGIVLARGELRRGTLLFSAVALVGILGPPMTLYYDARYAIPAFGPLAAAAAVGGAALAARVSAARGARSDRARAAPASPDPVETR